MTRLALCALAALVALSGPGPALAADPLGLAPRIEALIRSRAPRPIAQEHEQRAQLGVDAARGVGERIHEHVARLALGEPPRVQDHRPLADAEVAACLRALVGGGHAEPRHLDEVRNARDPLGRVALADQGVADLLGLSVAWSMFEAASARPSLKYV